MILVMAIFFLQQQVKGYIHHILHEAESCLRKMFQLQAGGFSLLSSTLTDFSPLQPPVCFSMDWLFWRGIFSIVVAAATPNLLRRHRNGRHVAHTCVPLEKGSKSNSR